MTVKVKKNEPSEQWSSGVWSAVRLDSVIFFEAVRDLCAVIVDQPGLEQRRRDEPLAVDQCRQFHIVVLDTELPPADRAGNRLSGPEMMMPILLPTTGFAERFEIGGHIERHCRRVRRVALHHARQLLASAGLDKCRDTAAALVLRLGHPLNALAPANAADDLLGGRRDDVAGVAANRRPPVAVDEEAIVYEHHAIVLSGLGARGDSTSASHLRTRRAELQFCPNSPPRR